MKVDASTRAFTLVELVIVLAVLGVLAITLRNPMKDYLRRVEFNNTVDHVKRLIQTCQTRAMTNPNLHIGLWFDFKGGRAVPFQDQANPSLYQYDGAGDPAYLQAAQLKRGVRFLPVAGFPDVVIFRGDGSTYRSLKVVVTDGVLKDTLDVLASTGRVRVLR